MLIGCDSASRYLRENGPFQTLQTRSRVAPLAGARKKSRVHPSPHAIVAEVEGAILSYHALHRGIEKLRGTY